MPIPKVRPDTYAAPDPAKWHRQYSLAPYRLPPHPELAAQAAELIHLDLSTLDAEAALAIQDELTQLCDGFLAHCDATNPEHARKLRGQAAAVCYYNAADTLFWAYPFHIVTGTKAATLYIENWFEGQKKKA